MAAVLTAPETLFHLITLGLTALQRLSRLLSVAAIHFGIMLLNIVIVLSALLLTAPREFWLRLTASFAAAGAGRISAGRRVVAAATRICTRIIGQ